MRPFSLTAVTTLLLGVFIPLPGLPGSLLAEVGQTPQGWEQSAARSGEASTWEWNTTEVLELVELAQQARREVARDGDLESYSALTEGHVYFFVDPEEGDPSLIRVDQVAVELLWQAPDLVQQRVVGERSEARLPVRDFQYYLDRLTLVQYGFGDEIQVGSGMDVSGVPHPLALQVAPGTEGAYYDYRVSDELSLQLPGEDAPLRLAEIEVRPTNHDQPSALGTILLDRSSGALVRMNLSFTPASYVDRRTDRISVEVDYGLWEGRFWLPNRQVIEVRREMPELDLGVGTVIRAVLRVGDYQLNAPVPPGLAQRPQVVWAPEEDRESYPFREALLAGLERDGVAGLDTRPNPRRIRAQASRLLSGNPSSGLRPIRLHLPHFSSALRYNRAEGLFVGLGGTLQPSPELRVRTHGGWAVGAGLPVASVRADGLWGDGHGWEVHGTLNQLDDLGARPGDAPVVSSLAATFRAEDYLDPFRVSSVGAAIHLDPPSPWRLTLATSAERHRNWTLTAQQAPLDRGRVFRPLRLVEEGSFVRARFQGIRPFALPVEGTGQLATTLTGLTGLHSEGTAGGVEMELTGGWASPAGSRELDLRLTGWSWHGEALPQVHGLLGGRGTVPGTSFRGWAGQTGAVATVEGAVDLGSPLVRLRSGIHAGWSGRLSPQVREAWNVSASGGIQPAVSLGLGLGWDLLRVAGARGLRDGEWQLLFSLDPRWWDHL